MEAGQTELPSGDRGRCSIMEKASSLTSYYTCSSGQIDFYFGGIFGILPYDKMIRYH